MDRKKHMAMLIDGPNTGWTRCGQNSAPFTTKVAAKVTCIACQKFIAAQVREKLEGWRSFNLNHSVYRP